MSYCNQCFNSIKGECPLEYCERRLKEASNARKQEIKMTRQEAIRSFFDIMYPDSCNIERDMKLAAKAIDAYEALGLIKFDKEEKTPLQIINAYNCPSARVIAEIENAGYRIVKIGQHTSVVMEGTGSQWNGILKSIEQS